MAHEDPLTESQHRFVDVYRNEGDEMTYDDVTYESDVRFVDELRVARIHAEEHAEEES